MNILYLHCHDLGRYLEPYGYAIPSPSLQKLAEEGVLFIQAFSIAPTCSPSRASLVTGQYPHCCGMYGLATDAAGYTLNDYSQHISLYLNQHDYETALSGEQHVAGLPWHDPNEVGYRRMLNNENSSTLPTNHHERVTKDAVNFIGEKHERPFFLSVGYEEPHRRNQVDKRVFSKSIETEPENIDDRYCQPMPHLPDNKTTRREMANFKQGVSIMDKSMGLVIEALKENNLYEDTIIICTTDHGPRLPGMKTTLTDRGTGVMLIIKGPKGSGFINGKVSDALVTHMDLYPMLCDLLEINKPHWLQGKSILPLVKDDAEKIHEEIFTEQNYHGPYRPLRAIRTEQYKYIRRFEKEQAKGVDRGPSQEMLDGFGWQELPQSSEELYDLVFDPHENNNLAYDANYNNILHDLSNRMNKWMIETQDPLKIDRSPEPPAWKHPEFGPETRY